MKDIDKIGQKVRLRSDRVFIALAILLAIFPIFVKDAYILNVLIIALIYVVLAGSWNIMCGYLKTFTFGHHAFFGIGAYVSSLLAMNFGISPWFGLIIGGISGAVLSFVIGLPCLRLRAAPYIAIATLSFAEISRLVCTNLTGLTRGEAGLWGIPSFPDITLPWIGVITFEGGAKIPYYYLILIIVIITMITIHLVINSHIGMAFRAVGESQDAAESLGINITYHKLFAFIVSGFFAGVVGSFYAHYILILTPSSIFGLTVMVDVVIFTFLGGLATFMGPVIGSLFLYIGLEHMRILGDYRLITYGILLVVIIIFIPTGIGAKLFREKELLE